MTELFALWPYAIITFAGVAIGVASALIPIFRRLNKQCECILEIKADVLAIQDQMQTHDVGCAKLISDGDMMSLSNQYLSAQVQKLETEITELKDRGF